MPDEEIKPEVHASDTVPVEVSSQEPLVVAKEQVETPAAAPEVAPATAEPAATAGRPQKLPDWAQKMLNAAEAEKRIAEREAKRLTDEVATLKAPKPEPVAPSPADDAAARANAPAGGYRTQAEFDAAVEAATNQRSVTAAMQRETEAFDAKSNEVYTAGKASFGEEFDTAAQNLRAVGAMNKDVLDLVFATDDPAKVLYELGSDPDKAASIIAMPAAKRAVAIATMAVGPAKKATPAALSNAPRPVPPVDGSARVTATPSDADDDETFFRKREAELAARRA